MSDFHLHHLFTTLHRLERLPLEEFESGLERAAARRRIALLLPCLASEMDGAALPETMEELEILPYEDHKSVIG